MTVPSVAPAPREQRARARVGEVRDGAHALRARDARRPLPLAARRVRRVVRVEHGDHRRGAGARVPDVDVAVARSRREEVRRARPHAHRLDGAAVGVVARELELRLDVEELARLVARARHEPPLARHPREVEERVVVRREAVVGALLRDAVPRVDHRHEARLVRHREHVAAPRVGAVAHAERRHAAPAAAAARARCRDVRSSRSARGETAAMRGGVRELRARDPELGSGAPWTLPSCRQSSESSRAARAPRRRGWRQTARLRHEEPRGAGRGAASRRGGGHAAHRWSRVTRG